MKKIHRNQFICLKNLNYLNLNNNEIEEINVYAFHVSIKKLNYQNKLANEFVGGLKNLVEIDLSNNRIQTIHPEIFHGLTQ